MALSSSISSALASICPEVTQTASMTNCTDQTVKIDGIWYKDPEDDELNKAGQNNATSLRNAMINSAALTAMQSATGGNCYTEHYMSGGTAKKRSYSDTARACLVGSTRTRRSWCEQSRGNYDHVPGDQIRGRAIPPAILERMRLPLQAGK